LGGRRGKQRREEETENAIPKITKSAGEYFVLPELLSTLLLLLFLSLTVLKHFSDTKMKATFGRSIYYDLIAIFCLFFYLS